VILVSPLTRTMQTATEMFPEAARAIAAAAAAQAAHATPQALHAHAQAHPGVPAAVTSLIPPAVPGHPSFVAIEMCREAHGGHPCDQRRSIAVLRREFPHVDFSLVDTDQDSWHDPARRCVRAWAQAGDQHTCACVYRPSSHQLIHLPFPSRTSRETVREVAVRGDKMLDILRSRSERNIVLVSHGVFLETLLNRCRSVTGERERQRGREKEETPQIRAGVPRPHPPPSPPPPFLLRSLACVDDTLRSRRFDNAEMRSIVVGGWGPVSYPPPLVAPARGALAQIAAAQHGQAAGPASSTSAAPASSGSGGAGGGAGSGGGGGAPGSSSMSWSSSGGK
jgi:uncharacterized membrane protein YgcG